jgi:hypothetical protein
MTGPSHTLLHSLLSLAEELRSLGIVYHPVRQRTIVEDVFRHFFTSVLDGNLNKMDETTLHDLVFLRALCELYGPSWDDISFQINQRLKSVVSAMPRFSFSSLTLCSLLTSSTKSHRLLPITLFVVRPYFPSCSLRVSFRSSMHLFSSLAFHLQDKTTPLPLILQNQALALACF